MKKKNQKLQTSTARQSLQASMPLTNALRHTSIDDSPFNQLKQSMDFGNPDIYKNNESHSQNLQKPELRPRASKFDESQEDSIEKSYPKYPKTPCSKKHSLQHEHEKKKETQVIQKDKLFQKAVKQTKQRIKTQKFYHQQKKLNEPKEIKAKPREMFKPKFSKEVVPNERSKPTQSNLKMAAIEGIREAIEGIKEAIEGIRQGKRALREAVEGIREGKRALRDATKFLHSIVGNDENEKKRQQMNKK